MSSEVAVPEEELTEHFQVSLDAEHDAERDLLKSLVKSILVSLPIMIGIFLLIAAIAFSDKVEWYVWVELRDRHSG